MVFKAVLAVLVILECVFTVWYLISIKPGFSKKTLALKITCSSIFVAAGVVSALGSESTGMLFPRLMIAGFICSWFGDIMLHLKPKTIQYIIGGAGFLTAHILYITAFIKTEGAITGSTEIFTLRDAVIIACVYLLSVILYFAFKLKAGKLLVPIMIYDLVLCFMLSKAMDLSYAMINSGMHAGILVAAGALLFVFSDFMLGIGFLGKPEYRKQVINMAAYFPAQMLLAISIYFIAR